MGDLGPFTGLGCVLTGLLTCAVVGAGAVGFIVFWFIVRPFL